MLRVDVLQECVCFCGCDILLVSLHGSPVCFVLTDEDGGAFHYTLCLKVVSPSWIDTLR